MFRGASLGVIYLDHAATTPPLPEVVEVMESYLRGQWFNPSSAYAGGRRARKALETARGELAALFEARAEEVVFTSCATESISAVHHSARLLFPDKPLLVTGATEHAAGVECARRWCETGGAAAVVPVDRDGVIDLDALRDLAKPGRTALVSIMLVNNETGTVQPAREAAEIAHAAGAYFHTDAVQAAGKLRMEGGATASADFVSFSGHKMGAARGAGGLLVSSRARFAPLLCGGGQEGERRGGTENTAAIAGLGVAATIARAGLQRGVMERVRALRDRFETLALAAAPEVRVNGAEAERAPHISSLLLPGCPAAGLLILLDKAGVCASAGSACHTGALHPSHVLEAMGMTAEDAASTVRFSFSPATTEEEVEKAAAALGAAAAKLASLNR